MPRTLGLCVLTMSFVSAACHTAGGPAPPVMGRASSPIVQVFYATDRKPLERRDEAQLYGGERSSDGRLALGIAEVSIPPNHKLCAVERASIWKLEFTNSTDRHMVVLRARQRTTQDFYAEMQRRTQTSKEAFVFVHGYNVTFEDALLKTAQLSHDLGFRGAAIAYSWPANGKLLAYAADEADARWTTPHLRWFLERVVRESGATTIHLVGHSMGSRPLSDALASMANRYRGVSNPPFQQLVLAAPDMDRDTFGQMVEQVRAPTAGATIYAAGNDTALLLSRRLHDSARLGDTIPSFFVSKYTESIDATAVNDGDVLGHSSFSDSCPVLADIHALFTGSSSAADRFGLDAVVSEDTAYFRFRPR